MQLLCAVSCRAPAQVVFYYISQSKANNHAVREASCAVIAELMEKVDKGAVSQHVPDLLRALLLCFKDSSWPVRDAACTACGRCVAAAVWAAAVTSLPLVKLDTATAGINTQGKQLGWGVTLSPSHLAGNCVGHVRNARLFDSCLVLHGAFHAAQVCGCLP
jgi:hypothetical protein